MDSTGAAIPARNGEDVHFGTLDLALADSRLWLVILNEGRHVALRRVFGIDRVNGNLLTAVLVLGAASASYAGARRVVHAPMAIRGTDVATGAMLARAAATGVAGPAAAATPGFALLIGGALVAGMAVPAVRRATHAARLAERRVREHRILRYIAARGDGAAAAASDVP